MSATNRRADCFSQGQPVRHCPFGGFGGESNAPAGALQEGLSRYKRSAVGAREGAAVGTCIYLSAWAIRGHQGASAAIRRQQRPGQVEKRVVFLLLGVIGLVCCMHA